MTGLDPAALGFNNVLDTERLHKTDAEYVEIISTCVGSIVGLGHPIPELFRFFDGFGHAWFLVNGGSKQPGCGILDLTCSHGRAYEYFLESINRPQFFGVRCATLEDARRGKCSDESVMMGGEPGNKK